MFITFVHLFVYLFIHSYSVTVYKCFSVIFAYIPSFFFFYVLCIEKNNLDNINIRAAQVVFNLSKFFPSAVTYWLFPSILLSWLNLTPQCLSKSCFKTLFWTKTLCALNRNIQNKNALWLLCNMPIGKYGAISLFKIHMFNNCYF